MKTKENKNLEKQVSKAEKKVVVETPKANINLNVLESLIQKANETEISNTSKVQKGIYKFVFCADEKENDFVIAQGFVKSLNFEKRNSSGQRSKFRKTLISLIEKFNAANEAEKQVLFIKFLQFYKGVYSTNDFTPNSLVSMSNEKYSLIDDFLKEIKILKIESQDYIQLMKAV